MSDANFPNPDQARSDSGTEDAASLAARLAAQGAELESARRELAGAQRDAQALQHTLRLRQRELDQLRATLSIALGTLREQLVRVERSAAWRYGHAATRTLTRLRGRSMRTSGGVIAAIGQVERIAQLAGVELPGVRAAQGARTAATPEGAGVLASPEDEQRLGAGIRELLGPPPPLSATPAVAAVILSRSPERVRAMLERLAATDYPQLEAVVVDNASDAGGVSALEERGASAPGARFVRLEHPASFAEACNRGAEATGAELLLFLNDDIHPVEPGWLAELVAASAAAEGALVGATLVDPLLEPGRAREGEGWRLEQRGILITLGQAGFEPVRREAGADVFGPGFGRTHACVAVSAACLLVPRAAFEALGGFDTGYHYGLEDVDLCLRARARGHAVLCSARAHVVHEGSRSQSERGREFRRINHSINRERFRRLWGATLRRRRVEGLLDGDPAWGEGVHLVIVRSSNDPHRGWGDYYTALELGTAAEALGWRVSYLAERDAHAPEVPDDADVAVVLTDGWDARRLPAWTLACAWIRNWTDRWLEQPWLERYDVLLASSERSAQLLEAATGAPVERFPLAANQHRFRPRPEPGRELDWVFTGNRWGHPRAIEAVLARRSGDRADVYGRGWDAVEPVRPLARGPLAYERLPDAYAAAKLVLDDTAEPTLAYDAVNSRVFDALASGALVLSNCVAGVHELFDEEFPTWSDAEELRHQLDRWLDGSADPQALAARYRAIVLERHTYEHRAARLAEIVGEHNQRLSFCLKIGAPDWEQAERWGDLHFATAMGRALRRLGHRWHVEVLPEWDSPGGSTYDVVIHLRGRSEYSPAPGQFNVLWLISHPETFSDELAEGFDLVCVASEPFAEQLRERLAVPVHVLDQATDPRLFFPEPEPSLAHELVFVGNSRGVRRKILDDLLPTRHDLAVWGSGWSGTAAEAHLVGEHISNRELHRVYSSAAVVLCDHWPDMRAAGFRSNRIYDALACGAVVVSDRVAGLAGALGEAVVTYEEPAELEHWIERLLGDPDERRRRGELGRRLVLQSETFDHRARALLEWVPDAVVEAS